MPETEEVGLGEILDRILGMLSRQIWWIMVPACIVALGTIGFVLHLPDHYKSEATLVFVPQQVSQRYVEPTGKENPTDLVRSMTHEILSRTRLLAIIDEFALYPKERQKLTPELLAEEMRTNDVDIEPLDATTFSISFTADTPQLAQTVTSRLTSLFVEENLKTQGQKAESTSNFLTSQLEESQRKLAEQDQRLRDFVGRNISALPEQQQATLGALTDLRMRYQNTTLRLSQAQQQRSFLSSTIGGNIARLQSERSALLQRYTEQHAQVVKKNQEIGAMQSLLERLDHPGDPSQSSTFIDDVSSVQLRNQIDANASEMAAVQRDQKSLEDQLTQAQDRLKLAPVVSQQLAAIQRDDDLYKQEYSSILKNQIQARQTASLEGSQQGQQFRVVDPATRPIKPTGPKRLKASAGGLAGGLVLGLALAFLMEMRNRSVRCEEELKRRFAAPLVLGIPLLLTPAEERARWRGAALTWVAGSMMSILVIVAELYVVRHG
jgi:polysaccharide biosynthesis transport protein